MVILVSSREATSGPQLVVHFPAVPAQPWQERPFHMSRPILWMFWCQGNFAHQSTCPQNRLFLVRLQSQVCTQKAVVQAISSVVAGQVTRLSQGWLVHRRSPQLVLMVVCYTVLQEKLIWRRQR